MRKILVLVIMLCFAYAGEMQEMFCGDKSLYYCTDHFDRQCSSKNYLVCFVVGKLHLEQERYSESKKYLEMVCEKANSKVSYQVERIDGGFGGELSAIEVVNMGYGDLSILYYNGWGVRQDYGKALQYAKKACDLGNANSCGGVGKIYYLGEGTKKDLKLAKNYYEKSCEMQSGLGCIFLGGMYFDGEGVAKNLSKAKELFGKACDLGIQASCDFYKELNKTKQ